MRTVLKNPWIPLEPSPKQAIYLTLPTEEGLYGGAAGPGKSVGLLMGAAQYIDTPGYSALLLRRAYTDLTRAGALIPMSQEWWAGTKARWNEQTHRWRFPSGATVEFGYLQTANDIYQYQSAQYQYIAFDELTQFEESQYRYLFSRLRRTRNLDVPLRMRAASNPGGRGHDWVKRRFMTEGRAYGRVYLPATLDDNPHIDRESYIKSLSNLDPITLQQLLKGDWNARHGGSMFQREWFEVVDQAPRECTWVRFWDLASTRKRPGTDPDFTAGALVGLHKGIWYIGGMVRRQDTPGVIEDLVKQTAATDGKKVRVRMEQEPGASGVNTIDSYARRVLVGYNFVGRRSTGSKVERARPLSSAAQLKNVKLVRGTWITAFLDEAEGFPQGAHDDQVDAVSGGMSSMIRQREPRPPPQPSKRSQWAD